MTLYDGLAPIEERLFDHDSSDGTTPLGTLQRRYYYEDGLNRLALVETYDGQGILDGAYVVYLFT